MSEQDNENDNSLNDEAQGALENHDDNQDNGQVANTNEYTEDVDELRERLAKAEATRDKNYVRMKEAQGFLKDSDGNWVRASKPQPRPATEPSRAPVDRDELSTKDAMALINAKVTEDDDIDIVKKYAKLQGVDVRTALQDNVVKGIISDNAEKRRTANATNIGKTRAGADKKSGTALLDKASRTGELPDNEDDMKKLAEEAFDQRTR